MSKYLSEPRMWEMRRHSGDRTSETGGGDLIDCDAVSHRLDDSNRCSLAITTMRPRNGHEYQLIDRRRLAEHSASADWLAQRSPASVTSIFTFDTTLSRYGGGNWSSGEESPKNPSMRSRIDSSPAAASAYVNMAPSSSRNGSPIILDAIHDIQRQYDAGAAAAALINYADIDLTQMTGGTDAPSPKPSGGGAAFKREDMSMTEYAIIDIAATSAAAVAGREHARLREDRLEQRERKLVDAGGGSSPDPRSATIGKPPFPRKPSDAALADLKAGKSLSRKASMPATEHGDVPEQKRSMSLNRCDAKLTAARE